MTDKTDKEPCVVCGMADNVDRNYESRPLVTHVDCPRCGPYMYTRLAFQPIPENRDRMYLLAGAIRSCKERGLACFMVDSHLLQTVEGFNEKVLPLVPKDDNAKMTLILQYVSRKVASGESVSLDPNLDYPVGFSKGPAEFNLLVTTLVKDGLLEVVSGHPKIRVILTVAGRQEIQSASRPPIGFGT